MITKDDILNAKNKEDALDMLLLAGPDRFDGTIEEYHKLIALLEEEVNHV